MKEKVFAILFLLLMIYLTYKFIHPFMAMAFFIIAGGVAICAINQDNDKLNEKEKGICKWSNEIF